MGQRHCAGFCGPTSSKDHEQQLEVDNLDNHEICRGGPTSAKSRSRGDDDAARARDAGNRSASFTLEKEDDFVTLEMVFGDLLRAEEVAYRPAFEVFAGGSQHASASDEMVRDFICGYSTLTRENYEERLVQDGHADECGNIPREGFINIMREYSIREEDIIEHFGRVTNDNTEPLTSPDCRTALLFLCQQSLGCDFTEDRWERMFDTVMWDAEILIDLEQWRSYSKNIARMVRVMCFTKL